MRRRNHKSRAMTLVELLVSLAILAALMGAAAEVLEVLRRSSQAVEARGDRNDTADALRRLLTMDCANATAIEAADGILMIQSTACLDERTLDLKYLPSMVTYRVITVDDRNWLVRQQQRADEVARVDLVCRNVTGIDCELFAEEPPATNDEAEVEESTPESQPTEQAAAALALNGDHVTITISFDDGTDDLSLSVFTFGIENVDEDMNEESGAESDETVDEP